MRGFKQHRIGAVVQATGTGKSYLLARYIADHAKEKILVFAPNITILDEIRKAVGFSIPQVTYRTFQSLIRNPVSYTHLDVYKIQGLFLSGYGNRYHVVHKHPEWSETLGTLEEIKNRINELSELLISLQSKG